ncbi:hypothetical protein ACH42_12135 [Endozoicomonas sp. (ex Bugula neritina AB1)]|nr:hypothetical protein ACH42_12135 [Endozoicomonas sp. (ex Bugula neritina AB1)]
MAEFMDINGSSGPASPSPSPKGKKNIDDDKENQPPENGGFTLGGSNIPKGSKGLKRSLAERLSNGKITASESGGPSVKQPKIDGNQPNKTDDTPKNEE